MQFTIRPWFVHAMLVPGMGAKLGGVRFVLFSTLYFYTFLRGYRENDVLSAVPYDCLRTASELEQF